MPQYGSRNTSLLIYPDDEGQRAVMRLIYDCVKSGHYEFDTSDFKKKLKAAGAESCPIILGCTELPIAFKHFAINEFLTIDPSVILAKAIIRAAGAEER